MRLIAHRELVKLELELDKALRAPQGSRIRKPLPQSQRRRARFLVSCSW